MAVTNLLAIDLGAESGRAVLGTLTDGRLTCEEVHRFTNTPVPVHDALYWNVLHLHQEIKAGIGKAVAQAEELAAVGIDSWAVDFGLIGPSGELLGGVHHYRDRRTDGLMERVSAHLGREEIYRNTGVQFLPFNTLYQLAALKSSEPALLAAAHRLLMVGELFTYFLTGEAVGEFTNATTTQVYHPGTGAWHEPFFDALGLPIEIMPPVVQPGTQVGTLLPSVADEVGVRPISVVLPAVHDTGSAVAAVPAEGEDWAFISSGTWSLVGVEVPQAILTDESLGLNISNEGGVAGTFRHLKNVMGLWILQECRRAWEREGDPLDYAELTRLAKGAPPLRAHVDPDDPRFFQPGDMPETIRSYLRETGQPVPATRGEVARVVLESLALKYRYVLEQLQRSTKRRVNVVHIVGGGARNALLNQMTADATGCEVLVGPYEATAIGNLTVQAVGMGVLPDQQAARAVVRRSFGVEAHRPADQAAWDDAYARFQRLLPPDLFQG